MQSPPIESNTYDEYMDNNTKSKFDAIIEKDPEYLTELHNIVTKNPEFLHMSELFRQLIDIKYQISIEGKNEEEAQLIAQNAETKNNVKKDLNESNLKTKLTEKLNEAFTNGVLIKKCDGGSNPIFGKTKKICCESICKKIDNLVNELEEILKQHGIDSLGNKTIAEVVPSLIGKFTVGDKKSNIFKYFKYCKEEKKIDETTYNRVRLNIEKLAFFLGISSQQEGGYSNTKRRSKNKYRHASKKSRKSRPRRRSLRNKKRHTKRHTKRYINRK